jgi:hypothetical protein
MSQDLTLIATQTRDAAPRAPAARPEREGLLRHGAAMYLLLTAGMTLAAFIGAVLNDEPRRLVPYVALLFALCATPLLLMRRLNDRYVLLAIFMALYFLFFGALDFSTLLLGGRALAQRESLFSPAELAILSGGALYLGGYLAGGVLGRPSLERTPPAEWPRSMVLLMGVVLWLAGIVAVLYLQLVVVPEKGNGAQGLAAMGPALTFVVMLGNMVQSLALVILAYGYARYRGAFWLALILMVVAAQVIVGFITDIKMQAMLAPALIIMTCTLVDNRLPKRWIVASVAMLMLSFPVFQAYRAEVTGERGLDRAHAVRELGKVFEIAFGSREKVTEGRADERAQTFLERSSNKGNLELLFAHVGSDVAFLHGRSLVSLPMAFVPRLLAPDKEDVSVGLLFNKEILKSDQPTYISISHLGELYWNFGWAGILLGMPLCGLILGFAGRKFSLEQGITLTRVMLLLVTVQNLCIDFDAMLPASYIVWLRSLAAIGLLHVVFARSSSAWPARQAAVTVGALPARRADRPGPPSPRFRNILS